MHQCIPYNANDLQPKIVKPIYVDPMANCPGEWKVTQTDLVHEPTGQVVYYETFYNPCGDEIMSQHYYFDPDSGVKTVTSTGFQSTPTASTSDQIAYETLANGAVEKLTKWTTVASGVPQAPIFTQYGSNAPYTPADLKRVEPKPIKVQMGQEDLTVTGAGIAFADFPVAQNSEGEDFPSHALIHVHVDSTDTAAGIAYTTDGSNPSESHEFERSEGQPIVLDTFEEIKGFRAAPLKPTGDIDASLKIEITVEYNNISPDKDDV